jgi:hypothetical protein
VLPDQAAAYCPRPNPVAQHQHANSLQITLFANELVVRSHEQKQVTRCFVTSSGDRCDAPPTLGHGATS